MLTVVAGKYSEISFYETYVNIIKSKDKKTNDCKLSDKNVNNANEVNLKISKFRKKDQFKEIKEINDAVGKKLRQRNMKVPFTIIRLDSLEQDSDSIGNEVTVGFAHPVTYAMTLGNVFPFLLSEISLPILFSLLLTGITLLSFVLLYRNLLQ